MANYIEGTLKIRGSFKNVMRFLTEGLSAKQKWLEIYNDEERSITDVRLNRCIQSVIVNGATDAHVWQEDYHVLYHEHKHGNRAYAVLGVSQAWAFKQTEWQKISKEYNVDLRLFGVERTIGFCQEIEIIKGQVVVNKDIRYLDRKDWGDLVS